MTLQLLGAGFGRTGTLSLQAALKTLGYAPCYHMVEVAKHPGHASAWLSAERGAAVDWPTLFASYAAAVDWPAAAFWREILRSFPAARVILTVRDGAAWYASFRDTILATATANLPPPESSPLRAVYDLTQELILDRVFGGRAADEASAIAVYEAHNRSVIDSVAPEQLLVYDLMASWEPLCRFLDRPIPREPFPHLNTRSGFLRHYLGRRQRNAIGRPATPS